MSKKYVIEIKPEYEDSFKGLMILGAKDSNLFVDTLAVENLEELNSDYISKHFSDLKEDAYQRGLDDAWEAARKIALMDTETSENVAGYFGLFRIMENLTPMQAIEKLKAYEEKQKHDDKIVVGDEVEWDNDFTGDRFIVTRIYQPYGKKEQCDGIDDDGDVYRAVLIESLVKTGRHFDIASILKEMQS